MQTMNLCLVGFGNVGRAFANLILKKESLLQENFRIKFLVTAIATGQHGRAINPNGLDVKRVLALVEKGLSIQPLSRESDITDTLDLIARSQAQVMLENTPVNYANGQPALDYIQYALQSGMHVVTANKGPVLHAYRDLTALAGQYRRHFLFESTVMDGAPIFSLFRSVLPVMQLNGFEGILNSCTNLLLDHMGEGETLEQAVEYARSIGITETDPSGDIDGWDAAIKVAILVNVLMGVPITLEDVHRKGVREISLEDIQQAKQEGSRWKLVCRADRKDGQVMASVAPEKVGSDSPLFSVKGTSSFVQFKTDCLPGLGILESNPGPTTTAYGLLSDLLSIVGEK